MKDRSLLRRRQRGAKRLIYNSELSALDESMVHADQIAHNIDEITLDKRQSRPRHSDVTSLMQSYGGKSLYSASNNFFVHTGGSGAHDVSEAPAHTVVSTTHTATVGSTTCASRASHDSRGVPRLDRDYTILAKLHLLRELREAARKENLEMCDDMSLSVTSSAEMNESGNDVRKRTRVKLPELTNVLTEKGVGKPLSEFWKNGRRCNTPEEPQLKHGYKPMLRGRRYVKLLERARFEREIISERAGAFCEAQRWQKTAQEKFRLLGLNAELSRDGSALEGAATPSSETDKQLDQKVMRQSAFSEEKRKRVEQWVHQATLMTRARQPHDPALITRSHTLFL